MTSTQAPGQNSSSELRRPVSKIELAPGAHIHMMGICGTAMASLAGLLKDRGYHVTGSDQNVYPPMSTQLQKIGIHIMEGYKRENLAKRPDLVIVGNVISRQYEEAQAAELNAQKENDLAYIQEHGTEEQYLLAQEAVAANDDLYLLNDLKEVTTTVEGDHGGKA